MARTRADVAKEPYRELTDRELNAKLKQFDTRFKRLEDQYLRMIGEQLRSIGTLAPSDVHRLEQMNIMHGNLRTIEHRIAVLTGSTAEEIDELLRACAQTDARIATKILGIKSIPNVRDNTYLMRILNAQIKETAGTLNNLSNTTVVSTFYRRAVDEAVQAAVTGVEDYNSAIRRVVREAGRSGLRVTDKCVTKVDYESGYSRRLDTAARMNVLDGMRHMNQDILNAVGDEFGANGVEIDAHMMCADDHLPYQGRQYTDKEFEKLQESLDRPFGEWNCRHVWHRVIIGVSPRLYSDEQLDEMRDYSTERIKIDGHTKSRYEWSQEMRRTETAIRQQKDTANLARASGDEELRKRCQGMVLQLDRYYDQITEASGIDPDYGRMYVAGFKDINAKE